MQHKNINQLTIDASLPRKLVDLYGRIALKNKKTIFARFVVDFYPGSSSSLRRTWSRFLRIDCTAQYVT